MKTKIQEKAALLVISDSVAILFSFILAILLGYKVPVTLDVYCSHRGGFAVLYLSAAITFFILDGYSLHKAPLRFASQAMVLGVGLLMSSFLSTVLFFFFRNPIPRGVFILFYVIAFGLVVFFRKIISQWMLSLVEVRTLLVGDGGKSLEVTQLINSSVYLRTVVVGYVSQGDGSRAQGKLSRLGNTQELVSIATEQAVDQVIVAVPFWEQNLVKLLLQCMQKKIKVLGFRRVIEEITGRVPIEHLNDNWFINELSTQDKRYFWYMKRTADIVVSCVGLCLSLPLLPLLALLVKLDSRGPVFYTQHRMGRGSIPFRAWKLRTMVDGADRNNVHWTTEKDGRITRIGKLIRRMRLDEVPQLINILKGEMTLIGPRPEALSLVELYNREIPYYPERHMVTPGITGWAQINYPYGNSVEDTRQKLMFDFYYIKNRCMTLDIQIFLRTIRIVLTGKGSL